MQIPVGNFGFKVAEPAQRVNAPAAAFGDAQGTADLGANLSNVADAMQAKQVKAAQEAERQMRERLQADAALERAKAANAVLDREIAVDAISKDISARVESGDLHYDQAPVEYKKAITALGTPKLTTSDPVTVENFDRGIKRADFKGESGIATVVTKARGADMRTQTDGVLDRLGKLAGMPGADVAAITKQADGLDELGRQAYGGAWGKKKQDFIDASWDAQLNQQAMSVRNDVKGVDALAQKVTSGEYADKLDSNRRNSLVAKLDGYKTSLIQRNEAAAARAERERERLLKHAEAEFNTFQALADKGTILSPEYVDRAVAATAGTPYQGGIKALAQQARETGGLASQPLRAQQSLLDQIDRQISATGRTPELDKRREQISKVLTASESDLKANGLRAGLERGVIAAIAPLDTSTPEGFAGSVAERIKQAGTVAAWAGKTVSPLDADEAETVRKMLSALPPKQRSEAVATISGAVGPKLAGAIAEQLDKQDRPLALAFATAGDRTTANRYTSELILKGAGAIKDGTVMKDSAKVTGWRATIATEVEGAIENEQAATAVKDAAYYIAAGIAHENGGSLSSSDLKNAVRLAVGGDVVEHNGKKIPIPAGMDQGDFEKRIKSVSAADIAKQSQDGKVRVGGVEMSAQDFAASVPGQQLMYAGPGRYFVIVKGRPVVNSQGKPITVGVK